MRILLTNDDGVFAPGLAVLEEIARSITDDVWIVAPHEEQSGKARAVTLTDPVRVRQEGEKRYAVAGTPADAVLLGVMDILKDHRPDLVLSGVNRGQNIAEDTSQSGTVAAAIEGMHLGVPSIAFSQSRNFRRGAPIPWETGRAWGPRVLKALLANPWPKNVVMNVNFPDRLADDVAGVEVTRQGFRDEAISTLDKRTDLRGNDYFWIGYSGKLSEPPEGTDLRAIYDGRISITPLHIDMTHHAYREELAKTLKLGPGKRWGMSEPYNFHAARLVLALRQSGVMDQRIMEALEKTPREPFVPRPFVDSAWDDIELPIDCGQNLTRPVIVGAMIQALDPKRENTVLEIGAGSGYSAAVLSRLARRVYSVDRYRTLVDRARGVLDQMGIERVELRHADGLNGWPEAAPFDRLLLMGSVTEVSPVLAAQVAVGGIVVAPIDGGPVQIIMKLVKQADGTFSQTPILRSSFAPLQQGVAREL